MVLKKTSAIKKMKKKRMTKKDFLVYGQGPSAVPSQNYAHNHDDGQLEDLAIRNLDATRYKCGTAGHWQQQHEREWHNCHENSNQFGSHNQAMGRMRMERNKIQNPVAPPPSNMDQPKNAG